jgi:hypothetical protein
VFPIAAYQFQPSGMDGAGFQNVIAIRPGNPDYVISGADVAGTHISIDGGRTWKLSNRGLEWPGTRHAAALAFLDEHTLYAAFGRGEGSGLYKSVDGGSWELVSGEVVFSGQNNRDSAVPAPHPRSTGNLIAFDSQKKFAYVGTYRDGVYRLNLHGEPNCTRIGLEGLYIRSLVIDPADDNVLYVATHHREDAAKSGVFKGVGVSVGSREHFARITCDHAAIAYYIEEMKFIDRNTMIAVGMDKDRVGQVYQVTSHGALWTQLLTVIGSNFTAVDGYLDRSTGRHFLIVGTSDHAKDNVSILRSIDSGETWQPVKAKPDFLVGGETWWYTPLNKNGLLNGATYVASQIAISKTPDRTMYVAGRAGVWKSTDWGASWVPSMRRLNVTFNRYVGVDPRTDRIFIIDTDWKVLWSDDRMEYVHQHLHGVNTNGVSGLALAIDATSSPSRIYLAVGNRDAGRNGAIYSTTNPVSGVWESENLEAAGLEGRRPMALAAKSVGDEQLLLAVIEDTGLLLKQGGSWRLVNREVAQNPKTKNAPLLYDTTRPAAYIYDRETGIWRSQDNGFTWSPLFSAPAERVNSLETGYLALDETRNILYFSNQDGLYFVNEASAADFPDPVKIELPENSAAGPLAFRQGRLYIAGIATGRGNPAQRPTADLFLYTPADGLLSAGDAFYRENGGFPVSIDVDSQANIYVGMFGPGVLVGLSINNNRLNSGGE